MGLLIRELFQGLVVAPMRCTLLLSPRHPLLISLTLVCVFVCVRTCGCKDLEKCIFFFHSVILSSVLKKKIIVYRESDKDPLRLSFDLFEKLSQWSLHYYYTVFSLHGVTLPPSHHPSISVLSR